MLFHLLGVGAEHRDIADDIRDHILVAIGLLRLHNLHNMGLYDELTLAGNLLGCSCLLYRGLNGLLLHSLLRNKI